MKRVVALCLLSGCLFLFSCTSKRDYPVAMQQAINCINTHPDSALILLNRFADSVSYASEEAQMYYRLLIIKAKDKLYIPHTTDSIISPIVNYYREKGDKERLFESYYYLGGIYRDMNDASRALKAYHQATNVGEDTDLHLLLGMTYGQMGTLFAYQKLYDESQSMIRKSLYYYGMLGDSVRYANLLRHLARTYDGKGNNDSALYYYKESYRIIRKCKEYKRAASIAGEMGCFYFGIGQTELAKNTLLKVLPTQSKSDNVLLYLGSIYKDEGNVDSARYYFKEVLKYGELHKQRSANLYLSKLEYEQGNVVLALDYDNKYQILKDSIDGLTRTNTVEKLHLLYSFQHEEQKNQNLELENESYLRQIYQLLFVLLLSITLAIVVIRYIRSRKQEAIDQEKRLRLIQEEQYRLSLAYIHENEEKLRELEEQLGDAGKQNDTLRQQLLLSQKEVLESSNRGKAALLSDRELMENSFRRSDVYALFHRAGDEKAKVTVADWDTLIEILNTTYPRFINRLYELYPALSRRELEVCCLIKVSLSYMEMSRILACTPSAITKTRQRLYKKIFKTEGDVESLDALIIDL